MIAAVPLTWLQLRRDKTRLLMAILGVSFAVVLIFMQLGFREALFSSSVRYHNAFDYDLALISPKTDFIVRPASF
jgi:putative ABC transport system permease protein